MKIHKINRIEDVGIDELNILILGDKAEIKDNTIEEIVRHGKIVIGIGKATSSIKRLMGKTMAINAYSPVLSILGLRLIGKIGTKYKGIVFGSNKISLEAVLNAIKELRETDNLKQDHTLKSQGWVKISSFIFKYICRPYGSIHIKEYAYIDTSEVDGMHDYYLIKEKTTLISGAKKYGSRWKNAGVKSIYNVAKYTSTFKIGDFDPDSDIYNPPKITVTITFYPLSVSWTYNNNHDIWQVDLQIYSTTKISWTHKFYLSSGNRTVKSGIGIVSDEDASGRISITIKGIFAKRSEYAYQYHTCSYPFIMYLSKP